jgi:hypothetical protein
MEINYDLIIKYLVTKKNIFASKKHILVYSELFPEKFKELIQNKFYRYGINQVDTKNINISFYNTLLTLLNKNFITYNTDEENEEIIKFMKSISKEIEKHTFPEYLSNINFKNVLDSISDEHIQVLSEILDVNFIILDFKEEKYKIIYPNLICNPYKTTLLIANYDEYYEPIVYEVDNKKLFSYNDQNIKKIYQLEFKQLETINKIYNFDDNLNEIIKEFNPESKIIDVDSNENNTFIKIYENEYTNTQLMKMTKKEIEVILKKKKIEVSNISKILKKEMIELILQVKI